MNRDEQPDGIAAIAATAEAQSATSGSVHTTLRALPGPATARDLPRILADLQTSRLVQVWEHITPESVRDLLVTAARDCVKAGITRVPDTVHDRAASDLLDFVVDVLAENPDHQIIAPRNKALIYASSSAFDRTDADEVTLHTYCVLSALWIMATTEQARTP